MDWNAVGDEAIDLLRRYLSIDKILAGTLERREPGVVVAPYVLSGFTDNWTFRGCGLHAYGWSPFVLEDGDAARIHGNDERISLVNLREGARHDTEMLLAIAAA